MNKENTEPNKKLENISNQEMFVELVRRINKWKEPNHFKFGGGDKETEKAGLELFKYLACILDSSSIDEIHHKDKNSLVDLSIGYNDWDAIIVYCKGVANKINEAKINKEKDRFYEIGFKDGQDSSKK